MLIDLLPAAEFSKVSIDIARRVVDRAVPPFDAELASLAIVEFSVVGGFDPTAEHADVVATKLACWTYNCLAVFESRPLVLEDAIPMPGDSAKLRAIASADTFRLDDYLRSPRDDLTSIVETIERLRSALGNLYRATQAFPVDLGADVVRRQSAVWLLRIVLLQNVSQPAVDVTGLLDTYAVPLDQALERLLGGPATQTYAPADS